MRFGEDKAKLAVLLYNKKAEESLNQSRLNQTTESKQTVINIELNDDEEEALDRLHDTLSNIKDEFDFINLNNYLKSTSKNLQVLKKNEDDDIMNIDKLKKFLDLYCLSNFFKQTQNVSNVNFLNHKDAIFIHKFDYINTVS